MNVKPLSHSVRHTMILFFVPKMCSVFFCLGLRESRVPSFLCQFIKYNSELSHCNYVEGLLKGRGNTSETITINKFLRKPTSSGSPEITICLGFWDTSKNSILPSYSTLSLQSTFKLVSHFMVRTSSCRMPDRW